MVAWPKPGTATSPTDVADVGDRRGRRHLPDGAALEVDGEVEARDRRARRGRSRMTMPEMANHRRQRPAKSKDVSPRKSRWKALWRRRAI